MFWYAVEKGDSLWMIAKKFGISLENLIKANSQIKDPNKIGIGEQVGIPLEEENGCFCYVVQSGDTMWAISKKFHIPREELLLANPQVEDADEILTGQNILIPQGREVCGDVGIERNNGAVYYVKNGDTLFLIAQRYALNMDTLKRANPEIGSGELLREGMQLYLPGFHYRKGGETLRSVAERYGVALEDLIEINPQLGMDDSVSGGEKIAIPRRRNGDIAVYTVKQGDTLYKIAQKYNISPEALLLANTDVVDSELIYPEQQLAVPGPYLVGKGDTFYCIGTLYGVSTASLVAANPDLNVDTLPVGAMVRIPVAESREARKGNEACGGVDYVMQSGDTLSSVARMYRVPLNELLYANEISDADKDDIRPGTVIHVPTGYVQCVCYEASCGDTLWRIAAKYGIRAGDLLTANPQISDGERIRIGDVLMIPLHTSCCDGLYREETTSPLVYPAVYTVQSGDTLYSVARRFGISVAQLRSANEAVKERDMIFPGQQLIILPERFREE